MSYNPYGGYGPPPSYSSFPGSGGPPGMAPPPGLGPPPGMSSAPGMAPPGVQQPSAAQANRPSGLPPNFQAPTNLPNINFNARVIRLGTSGGAKPTPTAPGRREDGPSPVGGRSGLGMERGGEHGRSGARDGLQSLVPLSSEEKLRTVFVGKIPEAVGNEGIEKILSAVGKLRRWDSSPSSTSEKTKFGFAQFEDPDSLSNAIELLQEIEVPAKKQKPKEASEDDKDDSFEGIEKVKLQFSVDESSTKYLESYKENNESKEDGRLETARTALKQAIRDLFYPRLISKADGDGDMAMMDANGTGENVEVVNIPLAQEDELADIPAEMREVVAAEIAAFRERSNRRDMERMKREEEMEEMERLRTGPSRMESPPPGSTNTIPLGPRGMNIPAGPKGANGNRVSFVNGGVSNAEMSIYHDEDGTDASDDELHRRQAAKQKSEEDKMYLEAERKWVNRERSRAAALGREKDREKQESDTLERRKQEQLDREKAWDDEREASRKTHLYYRDHAGWVRQRARERAEEQTRDDADRRAEEEDRRREMAELERARGMADSFLDQQAKEMEQREAIAAPQPFKLSLGAAAQKAQAQRAAPQRRTIAEVEGLLDDEEQDTTSRRQLVPIQLEPAAASSMSEEDISKALRSLAQEIPSEKDGLWAWTVQWEFLDESVMREKLRPFVEKKIVEYLGVQEEVIVEVIEEHLRKHGKPGELVDELAEALDDEAEDLVKKLWRMVIFFTECEKRGLPA